MGAKLHQRQLQAPRRKISSSLCGTCRIRRICLTRDRYRAQLHSYKHHGATKHKHRHQLSSLRNLKCWLLWPCASALEASLGLPWLNHVQRKPASVGKGGGGKKAVLQFQSVFCCGRFAYTSPDSLTSHPKKKKFWYAYFSDLALFPHLGIIVKHIDRQLQIYSQRACPIDFIPLSFLPPRALTRLFLF